MECELKQMFADEIHSDPWFNRFFCYRFRCDRFPRKTLIKLNNWNFLNRYRQTEKLRKQNKNGANSFVGIVLVSVCFIRVHKFVDLIQPGLLCWTLLDSVGLC